MSQYPTWLIVSWQVPRYPNGKIKNYIILYSTNQNLPYKDWPRYETEGILLLKVSHMYERATKKMILVWNFTVKPFYSLDIQLTFKRCLGWNIYFTIKF